MKKDPLSTKQIKELSKTISDWRVCENKLIKTFHFKNFIEAFAFMTKIAIIAETMCHHPEWSNVYSTVKISLTTHEISGISPLDFKLAKAIDEIKDS